MSLDHTNYKGEFIYIEELNAIHAGVRASQGSFSLPFDGWHYKNGEKCSIESATVAGDIKYLLKNIKNIENESGNLTRFLVMGKKIYQPELGNKKYITSFLFKLKF